MVIILISIKMIWFKSVKQAILQSVNGGCDNFQ